MPSNFVFHKGPENVLLTSLKCKILRHHLGGSANAFDSKWKKSYIIFIFLLVTFDKVYPEAIINHVMKTPLLLCDILKQGNFQQPALWYLLVLSWD